MMLVAETKRRREVVEKQYYEWNDGKKVDCALVYTALRTYADMYNGSLLFSRPLDALDKDQGGFYLADYMAVQYHMCIHFSLVACDKVYTSVNGIEWPVSGGTTELERCGRLPPILQVKGQG